MRKKSPYNPAQLNAFTPQDEAYLQEARRQAVRIALKEGKVSADRVTAVYPRPAFVSAKVAGSVFRRRDLFARVGVKKSDAPKRKSGLISVYQLANEDAARAFLNEN